jgi:WD40 repeat protein
MFLDASMELEERQIREQEEQRERELVAARKLAQEKEERLKAQARANQQLRRRAIFLASISALAIVLALIAIFFAKSAGENAVAAQDAQAVAQDRLALSEKQRLIAEGIVALEDKKSADIAALLALHVLKQGYDEHADRLLLRALEQDYPRVIFKHDQPVWAVDISPDGKSVVTGGPDRIVHVWDAASGKEIRQLVGHTSPISAAKFSADGKFIVTSAENIRVWNAETGQEISELASMLTNWQIALSPDGKYVAHGDGSSPSVRVWEIGGRPVQWLEGHSEPATAMEFSPDGTRLLSVGLDGVGILWDFRTGKEIRRFDTHGSELWAAAFSPDEKYVAAGGSITIWVWDVESGKLVRQFGGSQTTAALPLPHGRIEGKGIRDFISHQVGVGQIAFLPNGEYLVAGSDDGSVRMRNIQTGETVRQFLGHRASIFGLAVSRDGSKLVTASTDGNALLWEIVPEGEPLIIGEQAINSAALAPDGKTMAVSVKGNLRLYDAVTGAYSRDLADTSESEYGAASALAFSPDGKLLFGRYPNRGAQVWDIETGQVVAKFLRGYTEERLGVFSPDGKYIATAGEGGASLWMPGRSTVVQKFSGHPGTVGGVAFSPDGKSVATTSKQDNTASLWDLVSGKEMRTFVGHTAGVEGVDFSPDGRYLVTASEDKTLRVWDVATGSALRQFSGHTAAVHYVKYSPDGKFIVSSSDDHTVRLWDAAQGNQVRAFNTQGKVTSLGFYPASKRVYVVSDDGTVRVWRLDLNQVIQMACARLPRDLDAAEIQEYNVRDYVPVCPKK